MDSCTSDTSERAPQELRGSEILIKALQAEGVRQIFGYPGGAVLHIYDALFQQDSIQHISRAMSRPPCTRLTATRAPRARWAWRW